MPKRRSIACGTSQRMFLSPLNPTGKIPDMPGEAKRGGQGALPGPLGGAAGGSVSCGSALERPADGHTSRQALERAASGGLGDVLAPQGLAVTVPAAKLLAVAGPEDAVVLGPQHLHRAAGEAVCPDDFVLRRRAP